MSTDLIWILTGIFICISAGTLAYISLVQRIVKLETVLALLGEKAAKILHSPHTPELDALLEKYLDRYYELSYEEWQRLIHMCQEIEDDNKQSKECRALAAIVLAIASHKLFLAPPKATKHE